MSKIRRVIRKVNPAAARDVFDEALWPTFVALVVLGGFMMGVSAAYLKFSHTPWYANAITWMILIPVVIGGLMVAFQYIDNRVLRRSVQFSVIIAALLHAILIVQMGATNLITALLEPRANNQEQIERREARTIPEYHPSQLLPDEDRPQEEHEKPVETPDPEPRPEEITEREPVKPEPQPTVQPVPVPETEATVKTDPNVVRRNQENMTNPRQDDQASKMSRQQTPSQMKVSQQVDVPKEAQQSKPSAEAKPVEAVVQRQQSPTEVPRRAPQAEPTTNQPRETPQVARATAERAPTAESTAQPTLKKQEIKPLQTPTTQVAAADAPAAAKQTSPSALLPRNTAANKQVTTSPETTRAIAEASAQATAKPEAKVERRQDPSENQPTIAQSNVATPNKQVRVTDRPDVATSAPKAATAPGSEATSQEVALAPQQSSVQKAAEAAVTSAQPAQMPATLPNTTNQQQPATKIARTEGQQSPTATANPQAAPNPSRSSTKAPSIAASTPAATAPAAPTSNNATATEVAAASTAVRRQQSAAVEVSANTGEPTPAQVANTTPSVNASQARRATSQGTAAAETPSLANTNTPSPAATRGASSQMPNITTTAANVATNSSPSTAANPQPGASSALVSRQPTENASGATRTQPNLEVAAASSNTNISSPGAARAQQSAVPTLNSSAAPSDAPARATNSAALAMSPQAVESPAVRVAEQGAADPTASPARMALSKGLAGTAGAGQSPNLDSSSPNAPSPAMVASSAAQRAQASQEMAKGDALSPAAPSQVARSRAEASMPLSTMQAEAVEVATTGATSEAGETNASAAATLTRAAANAPASNVTAAKGSTDIDLGPTALVGDTGAGRAAGGGQPMLNFETKSTQIARNQSVGGAAQLALDNAKVDPTVAAPAGDGGGQPKMDTPGPAALAANRSIAGGEAALSGGPTAATEQGPQVETSTSALLAEANVSRADTAEGATGASAAGQPSLEDEEEKARRLARAAAGGAPQLALSAPTVADIPVSPMGDAGGGGSPNLNPAALSQATAVARTTSDGGAPAGGSAMASVEAPQASAAGGGEVVAAATVTKAEAAAGSAGPSITGGGTDAPQRAATGPTFAANVQAATVELAGAPESAGQTNGNPLEAQGILVAANSGGAQGAVSDLEVGAALSDAVVVASSVGPSGPATGRRQTSAAEGTGPAVGNLADAGSPGKQAATTSLLGGGGATVEVPQVGEVAETVAQVEMDHMGGMTSGKLAKQTGDAMTVNIEAVDGPGGLGAELTPRVGLNTRQARSDSLTVQIATSRFERQQVGGILAVNTAAIIPADSFARRNARTKGEDMGGGKGSPPPQTEDAIEAGLAFLARHQQPDGRWTLQGFGEETALQADSAATAMCLLAFQGAGYHHRDHQYREVVQRGLEFLLKNQKDNGDLFLPLDDDSNRSVWLYSHSIATLALCEAYGMTQDATLKEPAQKALDFIVNAQHKERGGWRYAPQIGSDTSVTGWMMMALKSGELANLKVPKETYTRIQTWLSAAAVSKEQPHLFRYNPYAPDTEEQRHGRAMSKTMTAVGLLMELYVGWKRDNPNMVAGAEFLKNNLPEIGTQRDPQRDTYYWYYGTQVMFHMGGEYWAAWNGRLHPMLIDSQVKDGPTAGSWNPRMPVPDRWAPHAGRLYVTATNLLSLEVYYRHLPLYEDTAK